jgi:diguanylate cyclase (GGDEF)-like protein
MRDENDMFSPVAWIGYTNESMANFKVHMYQTYNWRATNGHLENSAMINDLAPYMHTNVPDVQDTKDRVTIKSTIYSPIIIDGQLIGLMNMDSTMLNAFTEIDMELVNYMSQQIEITLTKHQLYDQVLYLSQHDELTGLFNRRQFESLVQEKINESKITDEDFCIILLDINDLKKINDSGHQVGDSYIQTFAKELKGLFRESDYFCRYGGDEFVGICTMKKEKIKERLENALKNLKTKPMFINDKNIIISFSFGITSYPNDGQDYDTLINVADRLMYENKLKSKK